MNNDITIDDCIEYFQDILTDGRVSGTDFELNEVETEIYKMTISTLNIINKSIKEDNNDK